MHRGQTQPWSGSGRGQGIFVVRVRWGSSARAVKVPPTPEKTCARTGGTWPTLCRLTEHPADRELPVHRTLMYEGTSVRARQGESVPKGRCQIRRLRQKRPPNHSVALISFASPRTIRPAPAGTVGIGAGAITALATGADMPSPAPSPTTPASSEIAPATAKRGARPFPRCGDGPEISRPAQ